MNRGKIMIKIIEEEKQKLFNITSGCASCGENKIKNNIKIIKVTPKYGGVGAEITLCKKCREELKELLSQ